MWVKSKFGEGGSQKKLERGDQFLSISNRTLLQSLELFKKFVWLWVMVVVIESDFSVKL